MLSPFIVQVSSLAKSVRKIAEMEEPIARVLSRVEVSLLEMRIMLYLFTNIRAGLTLISISDACFCIQISDGLVLEKTSSPMGVLLVVFESRPDALVQVNIKIPSYKTLWHLFIAKDVEDDLYIKHNILYLNGSFCFKMFMGQNFHITSLNLE